MSKAVFTCPKCSKVVRDLAGHDRRIHPPQSVEEAHSDFIEQSAEKLRRANMSQSVPEVEVLTVKKPTKERAPVSYHCVDCGAEFAGQVPTCPNCGTKFNWEGVGNAQN